MVKINKLRGIIIAVTVVIVLAVLIAVWLRIFWNGGEDTWIKDEKGVWIKHGVPVETPDYVNEQQEAILCADELYDNAESEGDIFLSQCLGTCEDYAVDIVNVPRNEDDDKIENQCSDYRNGIASHFIELDKNGEIVRVV